MKKYLLFDLDGTLTDPKVGITTCVQYALHSMGIEEPDLDKLEPFIGPPLKESFMEFYGMDEAQAETAIVKYRERFHDTGIFENKIYNGIPEMLRTLQSKGMCLAVASSKPTVYVQRILEHFKIDKYFKVVVGSELDGTRVNKDEVVAEALKRLFGEQPIQKEKVYMIGDRKFDVEGARALQVESVAVTYGYGSMEELKAAHADYIVRSVEELQKFLLRGTEEIEEKQGGNFQRIWRIIYAFLMFALLQNAVVSIIGAYLINSAGTMPQTWSDMILIKDAAGTIIGFTGNAKTVISALSFVAGILPSLSIAKFLIVKTAEHMKLSHLKREPVKNFVLMGMATVGAVMGLNLLFTLIGFTSRSDAYQAVVQTQYSAHFVIGIICYGLITPIVEELLFRGIIYNQLKRMVSLQVAMLLSACLFGVYHMNLVQGIYALIMGLLMAYAYEYFGDFKMPVVIHIMSNVLAYSLSHISGAVNGFVSWPVCIVFLILAVVSLLILKKQKRVV